MINLMDLEEYVHLVLESDVIINQRNPEKPNYDKFTGDFLSKIGNVKDMNCVVINDKELAQFLSSNNDVLYIYYDEKDKIEGTNIKSIYFDLVVNNFNIKVKCKNIFRLQLADFMKANDIKAFDVVFNISIPINGSDIVYDTAADLNNFYFELFVLNDKIGLDRTYFFSLDDKDTYTQFVTLINKSVSKAGGKEIQPEAVGGTGKINSTKLDAYGFVDTEERILTKTFLHNSDFIDDFNVEDMDFEEEQEGGEVKGGIVGMKNPTIYCFTTPELPYALKVGETVRPVVVRMNEWKEKAFPGLKFHKSWPATCKKWVFDDHLVHSYILEDTKNRRLQRSDFSEAGLEKNVYSREFFTRNGITNGEDMIEITDNAINEIKSAIRSNYEDLMVKLHRSDDSQNEVMNHSKSFFDERELQKETVDNFIGRITADDKSQDMMIFAVMRFGKTYTAIRCLQEFYKKNSGSRFSVICTAKPEVKDEWVKGINNYKTDYINSEGKRSDEGGEDLTERSFNDFEAYGLKELINEITASGKVELVNVTKTVKGKVKNYTVLPENALETYLNGTNKKIVLFLSLQDLSGSIEKVKPNHLFFYKYPVDMLLIDETHYGARGKSYGLSIDAKNKRRGLKNASDAAEDKKVEERINQLQVKDAIKLHLSGTPYRILRNQEFNEKDILASFTFTDLMEEKENWEKENEEARRKWADEHGDSVDNPYSVEKNPYYGIPQLLHYGYSLSDYELEQIAGNDINTQFAELFKVRDKVSKEEIKQDEETGEEAEENGEVNEGYLFEAKAKKKRPEKIEFVHEKDIIKFFQLIDGTIPSSRGNKVLSLLNLPEIKRGNMCKNIIVALPSKDSCDALQELLEREGLFDNFGKYTVINVAGYRHPVKTPIKKIVNSSEKTISLTCSMLLTGVTVPNWDTMFYMKDGEAPESYDQAKFRIQSPYIKEIPIVDKGLLTGTSDKVHKMKLDMKPQTIFVDFAVNRMYKLIAQQMECERICKKGKFDPKKFLKYAPILVNIGGRLVPMESTEFSKIITDLNASDGTGIMSDIIRSYMPDSFLEDEELMDVIKDYVAFEGKKKGGGEVEVETGKKNEDEENNGDKENKNEFEEIPPVENSEDENNGDSDEGNEGDESDGGDEGKKPLTEEEREALRKEEERQRIRNKWIEFIRNCILYTIVRKDRKTFEFDVNKNLAEELMESIKKEENKETVWNIFFNGAEDKKDTCVDFVVKILTVFNTKIFSTDDRGMLRTQFEGYIMKAEKMMSGENVFENIQTIFGDLASAKLGKTEIVTPTKLVKKCIDSDFVIFNKDSRVLDLYGSKIGEFAYYILEDCEKSAGIIQPENYFVVCKSKMVYEFNKVVLSYLGVPEENIIVIEDNEKILTEQLSKMGKFSVVLGNPPYQGKVDPLYMQITKAAYDTVLDEDGVMCMINPTTLVDTKYENDTVKNYKTKYSYLRLLDFVYEKGMRGVFTSAEINNDLAIFIYGHKGKNSLFDEDIKIKRFGDDYKKDKEIIESVKDVPMLGDFEKYIYIPGQSKALAKTYNKPGHCYVVASFNRGHQDKINGGNKWDWSTLINSDNFLIQYSLPNMGQSSFDFIDDKDGALKWIKWMNTDFVGFFVLYYKTSLSNPKSMFENIPQPPESGDFSDESLMKEFGLTKEQMKYIHKKMIPYGYKTRELIPDHKESSLLQFIDDLNNGKAKLPESKKGKKKETSVEPDSSPSSSETTPKSHLEKLKAQYSNPSKKIQKRREELEAEFAHAKEWGQTDYDDFWEWLVYEKFPEQDRSFLNDDEEDEA